MTTSGGPGLVAVSSDETRTQLIASTKRTADTRPNNEPQAKKLALVGILPNLPDVDHTRRHSTRPGERVAESSMQDMLDMSRGPSAAYNGSPETRHESINNIDHASMDPYAMPVLRSPSSAMRSSLSCNQGAQTAAMHGTTNGTSTHHTSEKPPSTSPAHPSGSEATLLSDARARLAAASYASPQTVHATTHVNASPVYQPYLPPILEQYGRPSTNAYSYSPHLPTMPPAYSQTQQYQVVPPAYRFFDAVHLEPLPAPLRPLSKPALSPYSSQLYDPRIDANKACSPQPTREATLARGSMYHPMMYHSNIGHCSPPSSLRAGASDSPSMLFSQSGQPVSRHSLSVAFSPDMDHKERASNYSTHTNLIAPDSIARWDHILRDLPSQQAYNTLYSNYTAAEAKPVQLGDSGFDGMADLSVLPSMRQNEPTTISSVHSKPHASDLKPGPTTPSLPASISSTSDSAATNKKGKKGSKKSAKQSASLPVGTIALETIASSKGINTAACTALQASFAGATHEPEYHIWDWTEAEAATARRLIRFTGVLNDQNGAVVISTQVVQPVDYDHVTETSSDTRRGAVVSCIFKDGLDSFRDESGQQPIYYVTHFDILRIVGAIFRDHGHEFSYDWRSKIRGQKLSKTRNISVDKPAPHLTTTVFTEFASQIVAYPEPRPRDIIRGMKAVPWEDISSILRDVISRFVIIR